MTLLEHSFVCDWRTCNDHKRCKARLGNFKHNLKNAGWTVAEYDAAYTAQGGCCAICHEPGESLCADHDHATGASRKLLCTACNLGLGCFRDNAAFLRAAADYLSG